MFHLPISISIGLIRNAVIFTMVGSRLSNAWGKEAIISKVWSFGKCAEILIFIPESCGYKVDVPEANLVPHEDTSARISVTICGPSKDQTVKLQFSPLIQASVLERFLWPSKTSRWNRLWDRDQQKKDHCQESPKGRCAQWCRGAGASHQKENYPKKMPFVLGLTL